MSEWPGQLTHCTRKSFTRSNLAVRKLPTISIVILKVKVEKRASKPRAMSVARGEAWYTLLAHAHYIFHKKLCALPCLYAEDYTSIQSFL